MLFIYVGLGGDGEMLFFLISMRKVPSKHKSNAKDTLIQYKKKKNLFVRYWC